MSYKRRNSNGANTSDYAENKYNQSDHAKRIKLLDGIGYTVASHYNSIEEKGLASRKESSIIFMRNFNNWIKTILINKSVDKVFQTKKKSSKIIVLDLGCGKGGDLFKWQKVDIHHYIGADIAGTSVAQCKERYSGNLNKQNMFSAEFLVADCTKVRLRPHFEDPNMTVDIVSCQFAFHYCFESLTQAEMMVKNISESLGPGGVFIGTTPNDNHIMSLVAKNDGKSYESGILKIKFPDDRPEPPPLFGDTYHFYLEGVVDCPEFIVHFDTVIRLFDKYGMELIYDRCFADMYRDCIKDKKFLQLLFRMRALQLVNVNDATEEFAHIREYAKQQGAYKVKTLSKSEWDAICIYRGFAFRKKLASSQ